MNPRPTSLQTSLFDSPQQAIRIDQRFNMLNADMLYWPNFLSPQQSQQTVLTLLGALHWEQRELHLYNKSHLTPRLVAWCADPGVNYSHSNDSAPIQAWPPALYAIKQRLEQLSGAPFNGALLNYYRNGEDCMGWHSDDEASLGEQPTIASISLGAERTFQFKPKPPQTGERIDLQLGDGSLLLMRGNTQKFWQHALPKRKIIQQARLNITFRYVHGI